MAQLVLQGRYTGINNLFNSHRMTTKKLAVISLFILGVLLQINKAAAQTNNQQTDSLVVYRKMIDSLDNQLINILGNRMKVVTMVGMYKAKNNIPALQQSRFDALVKKNVEAGKPWDLSEQFIIEIMNAIHKESLAKEEALRSSH